MRVPLRTRQPDAGLGRTLWYEFCRWTVRLLYWLLYRPIVSGAENVPARGPLLLAANHQSYIDPPFVCLYIERHTSFVARAGLFKSRFFGWLIDSLNATPVKEEGSDAAAIKEVLRRLGRGHAVIIFPEGSRCEDGSMDEFKRGVALLVKKAKCPVVPVALEGCFDAFPRGQHPRVVGKRIGLRYGTPISPDELFADGADAGLQRLARDVDDLRLKLRAEMRAATGGRFPPAGPGDAPCWQKTKRPAARQGDSVAGDAAGEKEVRGSVTEAQANDGA